MNTQDKKQNYSIKRQSMIKGAISKCDIPKLRHLLEKEEISGKDRKVMFSGLKLCINNLRKKDKYLEVAELLLHYISPFHIEDHSSHESSGFMQAVIKHELRMIKLFLNYLKKKQPVDSVMKSILQNSVFACLTQFEDNPFYGQILSVIINETNLNLDFEDESCTPPLQYAVRMRNVKLVKILLKGNCDVNYKNSKNENTALHLAAHQNDEDLVRLLLNNDASVIVQNSKRMVPNGFTTNMNIIKLLNHKASEYESRAIRQRNKLPHEINNRNFKYTLRQPPIFAGVGNKKGKKRKGKEATKLKVDPKNTFIPDNNMMVPNEPEHQPQGPPLQQMQKLGNPHHHQQQNIMANVSYNQQIVMHNNPDAMVTPNPNIPNENYVPQSQKSISGRSKKGNKYFSYEVKEGGYSLRGATESRSSAPYNSYKNKGAQNFSKNGFSGNPNLLNNLNNEAQNHISVSNRRSSQQVSSEVNSQRGYQDFNLDNEMGGQNLNFKNGNLRFNKPNSNWTQSARADGSLPNSPMIENPRLQLNHGNLNGNLITPGNRTPDGPISRHSRKKNGNNFHPAMQSDIPYYPNYSHGSQSVPHNNINSTDTEILGDVSEYKFDWLKNRGNNLNFNDNGAVMPGRGERRPSENTHQSSASDKEEIRERLNKLKKVLAKKEKTERELYLQKEDLKREARDLDFLFSRKMEVKKTNQNKCLDCSRLFDLKYNELNFTKKIQSILHEEALRFEMQVDEMNEEQRPRLEEIVALMDDIIKSVLPEAKIDLFGSFATGLCLPWSDIDIVLDIENDRCPSSYEALSAVEQALLERTDLFEEVKYISNASFPVIKIVCTEKYLNKKLDITLQDDRHNGLNCVDLVKEYLVEYEGLLKPIVFVVKHLLFLAGLNDPYQGGLSSYGLILMIVSLLQSCSIRGETVEYLRENLGRTLLEFLNTYGNLIDYSMVEVMPNLPNEKNPNLPFQQSQRLFNMNIMMNNNYYLSVVDPLNQNNNVTRSTHRYYVIRMIFSYAYLSVSQPCSCDFKSMTRMSKKTGRMPPMSEYFELKYGDNSTMEKWKVLIKIFNAHKSPVFLLYSTFPQQN